MILRRLEATFGKTVLQNIIQDGVPQDMDSAIALAHKQDDRLRKEFEKWAILTYSENKALINEKKGKDMGIDGISFVQDYDTETATKEIKEVIYSVKSGHVGSALIRDLRGAIEREKAVAGIFLTLEKPSKDMLKEAVSAGFYENKLLNKSFQKIKIVTIEALLKGETLDIPASLEILSKAELKGYENKNQRLIFE